MAPYDHRLKSPHKPTTPKQNKQTAIEADERDFQLYASGVLTAECGTNLDHGWVLNVLVDLSFMQTV